MDRDLAEDDYRHTITMIAANNYMIPRTDINLILNVDATQFKVGDKTDLPELVLIDKKPTAGLAPRSVTVTKDTGKTSTAFFMKYHMLMSAGGFTSEPI